MAAPQLKLVADPAPGFSQTQDPTRQVFEHWLFMTGRSPARCKLGPIRRQAINAALAMGYALDFLLAAIEGMAGDPLERATADHIRERMREIDWLLGAESRIEHWADKGLLLRAQAVADAAPVPLAEPAAPVCPAAVAAAKERLRRTVMQARGGQHG